MAFTKVKNVAVSTSIRVKNLSPKKKILIGGGVAVLGVALLLVLVIVNKGEAPEPEYTTEACAGLYAEASNDLSAGVAEKIQQVPGYDKDTGCTYLLTSYYLKVGDSGKARQSYDKLAVAYEQTGALGKAPIVGRSDIEGVKSEVEWREKSNETSRQNDKGFGMPVQ